MLEMPFFRVPLHLAAPQRLSLGTLFYQPLLDRQRALAQQGGRLLALVLQMLLAYLQPVLLAPFPPALRTH